MSNIKAWIISGLENDSTHSSIHLFFSLTSQQFCAFPCFPPSSHSTLSPTRPCPLSLCPLKFYPLVSASQGIPLVGHPSRSQGPFQAIETFPSFEALFCLVPRPSVCNRLGSEHWTAMYLSSHDLTTHVLISCFPSRLYFFPKGRDLCDTYFNPPSMLCIL